MNEQQNFNARNEYFHIHDASKHFIEKFEHLETLDILSSLSDGIVNLKIREKKFKSSESTAEFQVSGKSKFEKLKIERKIDEPPGFQPVRA